MKIYEQQFYETIIKELPQIRKALEGLAKSHNEIADMKKSKYEPKKIKQ
jgi:hypothetical protein